MKFGLIPSARSLEAVGKSVCFHIIGRSKVFDLFEGASNKLGLIEIVTNETYLLNEDSINLKEET